MGGRIYDQLGAQFMTADPIMQAPFWSQGLNRYAYAFNDPVNNVDPSGFQALSILSCGSDYFCAELDYPEEAGGGGGFGQSIAGPGMSTGAAFGSGGPAGGGGAALSVWGKSIGIAQSGMRGWPGYAGAAHTGYSYPGTAPSGAPGTTSGTQGGQHAIAQNEGGVGPTISATLPSGPSVGGRQAQMLTVGAQRAKPTPGPYLEPNGTGSYRLSAAGRRRIVPTFKKYFVSDVDPVDTNYTLDQIAERVGINIAAGLP